MERTEEVREDGEDGGGQGRIEEARGGRRRPGRMGRTEEAGEDGGDQGKMEEAREDGEDRGGWGGWRRPEEDGEEAREDGEAGGGQDTGMGPREGPSVLPGQHSAHSALRGPFCSLLPEEAGQCTCSVLGEHLRGSLGQDMALLPLKPIPSCSQAGPLTDREPPPPPNHDPGHGCVGQGSTPGCPGGPWSWAHLSSPGSCWSRRQAGLGSPPGSAASGTPCNAAQHTPAGGSRSGLFWRPLGPPQDWDDLETGGCQRVVLGTLDLSSGPGKPCSSSSTLLPYWACREMKVLEHSTGDTSEAGAQPRAF